MREPHTIDFGQFKDRNLEDVPRRYLETVPYWDMPKGYSPEDWACLQREVLEELAIRDGDKGRWPKTVKGLDVVCVCGAQLRVQGGLFFGPPDGEGRVSKMHLCRRCVIKVRSFLRTLKNEANKD